MLQLALAASAFTVATAVYGAIGLHWRRRARIRREILGLVGALDLEPYHAAAMESRATEAAAAELLLGGYLDIDGEGAALLAEAGRDPGPDARPSAARRPARGRASAGSAPPMRICGTCYANAAGRSARPAARGRCTRDK
ncbi:hypothetical protein [Streptomyces solicathayae]|uniref:Secreted protein n=1 Tax=Streptomyces solicathayae TaxID=3081768 RepID=A0ABZ0LLA8_9ACTN|nr:hypothetical protein [Streptomyces sp. HUAS YS2]WOX20283.1 hypothetical protein R2D22_02295 [Streptomyces sp. HUAS YS2]